MFDDKFVAIIGFTAVALFAVYQGGPESYELIEKIVLAIAGFVTGQALKK